MNGIKLKIILAIASLAALYGLVMMIAFLVDGLSHGEWYKLVVVIPLLVLISAGRTIYKTFIAPMKLNKKMAASGTKSIGLVQSVEQTGTYINNQPQLRIALQVVDANGETFPAVMTEVVPLTEMHNLVPGAPLPVIYDDAKSNCVYDRQPDVAKMQDQMDRYAAKHDENGITYEDRVALRTQGKQISVIVKDLKLIENRENDKFLIELAVELPESIAHSEREVSRRLVVNRSMRDTLQIGKIIDVMVIPGKENQFYLQNNVGKSLGM